MQNKLKIIPFVTLIIAMLSLIFVYSNMNSSETNDKSKTIIKIVLTKVNKNLSIEETNKIVKKLNVPFRKTLHFLEYLTLTIFIIYFFKYLNFNKKDIFIISLLLCFSFATIDEIHQLLIGRTGSFIDVLIDTTGGFIPCIIYRFKK